MKPAHPARAPPSESRAWKAVTNLTPCSHASTRCLKNQLSTIPIAPARAWRCTGCYMVVYPLIRAWMAVLVPRTPTSFLPEEDRAIHDHRAVTFRCHHG
ncbi:hypothetical protein ACLK19_23650 [Escherichia coli]